MELPYNWRVTKYNPARRNVEGHYPVDEWTFFGEIGNVFNGQLLTYEDYFTAESAYVDAVSAFLSASSLDILWVVHGGIAGIGYDRNDPYRDIALVPSSVKPGFRVGPDTLADVVRLNLRDILWCKLELSPQFYLHFGWDFYMFIGSRFPCVEAIQYTESQGLFVEVFKSPYL